MARWQDVNGIYQIYPRSFKDSNGDGVGDIAGITQQLDYIKGSPNSLGIDAVWVSPFYRSPMADFGYDVSDYYSIDPLFGDLEDFKEFLAEAHNRDIKVMVDFVPNHTSDQHPWFVASRSSRDNDKRDWYIWRDPKPDGSPPNNWLSVFGGSAWELDEATGQYYLHSFLAAQPDLNWDNPEVRRAMGDVLDFWLSLGVDGIRADAVRWISKDPEFRDNPLNTEYHGSTEDPYHAQRQLYSRYGQKLFSYLADLAEVIEKYPDRIILFEDYLDQFLDSKDQYTAFYAVNPSVAAPFNFEGLGVGYSAQDFRGFINRFQKIAGNKLRPFYCFGNHDTSRIVSRFGEREARLVALLQLTLPGIPVVYYGDEIGMHDVPIPPGSIRDPFELQTPGLGLGRDPQRTPMQWTDEKYAGFSTAKPWLPVPKDADLRNVALQTPDPMSTLSLYRTLLELRRTAALRTGRYVEWSGASEAVFGYSRQGEYETLLILLNMSGVAVECHENIAGEVIYSTHSSISFKVTDTILLEPHQGVIIRRASN